MVPSGSRATFQIGGTLYGILVVEANSTPLTLLDEVPQGVSPYWDGGGTFAVTGWTLRIDRRIYGLAGLHSSAKSIR